LQSAALIFFETKKTCLNSLPHRFRWQEIKKKFIAREKNASNLYPKGVDYLYKFLIRVNSSPAEERLFEIDARKCGVDFQAAASVKILRD
jgi:hypothetical protein